MKEPSGVNVKENSYRNAQGGEACNIELEKIRFSQEAPSPKKQDIRIPLPIDDDILRKSEQENKFYAEFVEKRKMEKDVEMKSREMQMSQEEGLREIKEVSENEEGKMMSKKSDEVNYKKVLSKNLPTEKRVIKEMLAEPQMQENNESVPRPVTETVNSAAIRPHLETYKVVKILGKSEGILYELEDQKDNSKAVLRMIRKSNFNSDDKESISEKITAKAYTSDLNHPNIIKFKD
jgi:predicted transcriptional regulator